MGGPHLPAAGSAARVAPAEGEVLAADLLQERAVRAAAQLPCHIRAQVPPAPRQHDLRRAQLGTHDPRRDSSSAPSLSSGVGQRRTSFPT